MSVLDPHPHGPRRSPWIRASIGGLCTASVACVVWTAARPAAEPCDGAGPSAALDAAAHGPRGSAPGDPIRQTGWRPPSRAEGRELIARRLGAERAARAQRQELLARRRHALRSSPPGSGLDRRVKEAFEEEVQQLTERVARDLRASPGEP